VDSRVGTTFGKYNITRLLGKGGMGEAEVSQHLVGANARLDRQTAVLIIVDAAQAYCPQFVHQMANGATVVGPH
jgi:Protein of unknown function (DUF732)